MSVCEQSGEARRAEDSDFGEPSELYSGAFFEEENRSLPLTDDEVDEICDYQDAFQARTELSQAKLIPDLCILRTILEPKETVPIGDCSRAEPLTPPRSATPAPRKRRLSNAFPSDHDSKAKRIRLDA
ncbi:hypothetical protein CEP52_017267 [Fusarium oligoseptatum]|uniref:Uncharacterized protein n=1 Tax=Fusarium oligoseptatum TaxID=2604345 RepID=A0A428RUU3_9HYPO|nr:hypothetical protein CEP52_017267 [Fusarium oligoseptatum]